MSLHWDERYNRKEYVYGSTPNVFFENQLTDLKPGDILLPCEGRDVMLYLLHSQIGML